MSVLNALSVNEAGKLIQSGEITPLELVSSCLERILEVEDKVKAWRIVDKDGMMEAAEQLTKEIKAGKNRGPLHGIPIGVKDSIDVMSLPTRVGSQVWENALPAKKDAPVIARLRKQGAIIIGKTHTSELAWLEPGPTRNPYNLEHTPGGSSSGSAAAIAACMVPLTIGTQTGSSICRPAAYCGTSGFKLTTHSVPTEGVFPVSYSFENIGFFGRKISDVAAGYLAVRETPQSDDHVPLIGKSFRIGIVSDPIYDKKSHSVNEFLLDTIERFQKANHIVESITPPFSFAQLKELHQFIVSYEAAQLYTTLVKDHGQKISKKFRDLIESGRQISNKDYKDAIILLNTIKSKTWKIFSDYDVLLSIPTDSTAPKGLEFGDHRFTVPWTVLGGPLAVMSGALDENGLPLSVLCATPPGTDPYLINLCLVLEAELDTIPLAVI